MLPLPPTEIARDTSETRPRHFIHPRSPETRYHCTGYAFVTFNEAAVAKRVLETMPQDRASCTLVYSRLITISANLG